MLNATANPEIRAVIVEDEPLAIRKLKKLLESESGVKVVGEAENIGAAVTQIRRLRPNVVFLDIQLPGGSGFDVLEQTSDVPTPYVVFTTAYDQYAIKAFDHHAIDYLLKPFDQERLHRAVDKVRSQVITPSDREWAQRLLRVLEQFPNRPENRDSKLVFKSGGRLVFLEQDEIEWIEADSNYVRIQCGPVNHYVRNTIRDLETRLHPAKFLRVHRSIIVNVNRIKELQPCNSGEYVVVMKSGRELPCSRTYRGAIDAVIRERL